MIDFYKICQKSKKYEQINQNGLIHTKTTYLKIDK